MQQLFTLLRIFCSFKPAWIKCRKHCIRLTIYPPNSHTSSNIHQLRETRPRKRGNTKKCNKILTAFRTKSLKTISCNPQRVFLSYYWFLISAAFKTVCNLFNTLNKHNASYKNRLLSDTASHQTEVSCVVAIMP